MRLHAGGLCIRRMQADDLQAVLGLVRQLPGNIIRWSKEASFTQVFQDLLEGKGKEAFVATLHQRVIGFVSLYYMRVLHHGGTVASIQELVVTEELRGRGVGRALVDFARARAQELCCAGVEVAAGQPGLGKRLGRIGALDHFAPVP
ncbi:MAG: GNAT family N-acetyltransferase [Bacteroidota bacterium]